jgi:hypothetical protein
LRVVDSLTPKAATDRMTEVAGAGALLELRRGAYLMLALPARPVGLGAPFHVESHSERNTPRRTGQALTAVRTDPGKTLALIDTERL